MLVETLPVGLLQCNCTILACEETREALVVDPGDEPDRVLEVVRGNGLHVRAVIHTHAHIDHVMGTGGVVAETGAPPRLHEGDRFLYENLPMQGMILGLRPKEAPPLAEPLRDGEAIGFGRETARVVHTPGHTPGSVCFLLELAGHPPLLLSGDTLFRGSIGRTDLWGGDFDTIMASLRDRVLPLEDDTRVIPGHGPETRIGSERKRNPFLQELGAT
jgi:glyoxylase-like metal-dependent hydrolase (beta-lactamase superfamily II)